MKDKEIMREESEIARLKAQITLETEAGWRGIYGLASGISKHDFITLRMERMGLLHGQLKDLIGNTEATYYLLDAMNQSSSSSASGTS